MPNLIDTRRAVMIEAETHQELSELKKEEGLTFDGMQKKLINFYKANNVEEIPQMKGTREALDSLSIMDKK